jgi:serine phosphatase RsbU (regulator of sigma subunit)
MAGAATMRVRWWSPEVMPVTDDLHTDLERVLRESKLPPELLRTLRHDLDRSDPGGGLVAALRRLAEILAERERDLQWHQLELEQTNAGLLALHAEVDRQRLRTAFLDEVSRASATSLDRTQMLNEVAALLVSHDFADSTRVWTAVECGLASPSDPQHEPDDTTKAAFRLREPARDGAYRISVPLTAGSHVLGVFDLHRDFEEFTADDVGLAQGIAHRAAAGLRNANEYEREHELAERLQRAMLPTLESRRDLGIVARYQSATSGVHVGGDWYDAVELPDGTVVLTVGDVTGHGVDAAVVMGKLQNALRAYAMEGHSPATALRLVHELLRRSSTALFATAVVAEITPGSGTLRWASAGHPPPLVHEPSGQVRYLEKPHAPMLGIHINSGDTAIPEHECQLTPGSTVALYTDGLIERRSSDLDAGLERLADAVSSCGSESLVGRAEHVLRVMLGNSDHDDDVCLMMCQWAGPSHPGEAEAARERD